MINHFGYVHSSHRHVVMADGSEADLGPSDLGPIPAGHDACVVGDEPFVTLDMVGAIRSE
jgi:hypothetical protein